MVLISQIEPKNIEEALQDDSWITAMQEELEQFDRNEVWTLIPKPQDQSTIRTRWVFKNKQNEDGKIVRNKAKLVAKGYNQEFRIDFKESFAPDARLEAVRLLLAYASSKNIKLYQVDVKRAFLNGYIKEDVYVTQHQVLKTPTMFLNSRKHSMD